MYFLSVHNATANSKIHMDTLSLTKHLDNIVVDDESLQQIILLLQEEISKIIPVRGRKIYHTFEVIERNGILLIQAGENISVHARHILNTITCDAANPAIPADFFHPKSS